METPNFKSAIRDTSSLLCVKQINICHFIQTEDKKSFLKLSFDHPNQIAKLHIIGTVVEKQNQGSITNVLLDDGTDTILLRFFEKNKKIESVKIGDVLRCIGRAREYNKERYIFPDCIQKVDPLWLKWFHKKINPSRVFTNQINSSKINSLKQETSSQKKQKTPEPKVIPPSKKIEQGISSFDQLLTFIKDEDQGDGILIELLLQKTNIQNAQKMIDKMIESGDVFQNAPGKIKIL
ncbi:OB-fold nucleic acid binding domain-containing protein [archaeon]|jgi:RPA family protein|nr:OB-fold nucleic acid binding domain-containing protein [archaeon]MBT6697824.1 OB-fold nucleic acid binding domain-containing protein [archaeon]